jgi:hemerythrin-like domain-containing protein
MQAMRIIENEHRALAAVLHGLRYHVGEIAKQRSPANFELLGAMIYYIDAFPERLHHPKEDAFLFRHLEARHPPAKALLDRLRREHVVGATKVRDLEQALLRYQSGGAAEFDAFATEVEAFIAFERNHMRTEELEVFALAQMHLDAADWKEIDAAFAANADPLVGVEVKEQMRELFQHIVNLAPPPLGLGLGRRG